VVREQSASAAAKFADYHRRLTQMPVLQERWSIIYLLHMLSDKSQSTRDVTAPAFSSAFHSLGLESTDVVNNVTAIARVQSGDTKSGPVQVVGTQQLSKAAEKVIELQNGASEVTEDALLRDIIFALQGIDGHYIKFDVVTDGYAVDRKIAVLQPTRDLVQRICELGWLFGKVREFVNTRTKEAYLGLVGQSLCAALHAELSDYYRLIAVLESQLSNPLEDKSSSDTMTLRRLFVWVQEPLDRMKLMAIIVDTCKGMKGGSLASKIHSFLQHGDPAYRTFITRLMRQICRPIFAMLRRWMVDGQLEDPFHEFFIVADSAVPEEDMWRSKYHIEQSLLPLFISDDLAKQILLIGKSINFIRQSCNDREWVLDSNTLAGLDEGLEYGETTTLERMVDMVAEKVNKHVLHLLFDTYKFKEHCLAIKRYLLLGQGDFIQYLMDTLGPDLSKPANQLVNFRHNLTNVLESAIRASNVQFDDADLSRRLGVRIGQHLPGDEGWDVFSLEYKVDSPVNMVLRKDVMEAYLRIFNFLWRLKRVEYSLTSTWRRQMTTSRMMAARPLCGEGLELTDLQKDFHKGHLLRNEMIHLVYNLQYYMMFEVAETSWTDFEKGMDNAKNLDELIAAHQQYIDHILERALMTKATEGLKNHLDSIFKIIIQFRHTQDNLYDQADSLIDQHKEHVRQQKATEADGEWGASPDLPRRMTAQAQKQLAPVLVEYEKHFQDFLKSLGEHTMTVSELQSIAFRLDFNEHYHVKVETAAKAKLEQGWERAAAAQGKDYDDDDEDFGI